MKERVTRALIKISYVLFALFISIALWMYVEITENRMQERGIPVREIRLVNQDLLSSRRLLVSSVLTNNLVLTFEGPRAEISNLLRGSVDIEVDLESVREAGTVALNYTVILPDNVSESNVTVTASSSSLVLLSIDKLMSQEFPVEVNYTGGTASSEFIAEPAAYEPRTITVSGPETIVSQIAHIYAPIIAENLSSTYTGDLSIMPVGENGEALDIELLESETLTFSAETIRVTIPIRQLKTLPLLIEASHGATTSDSNTAWSSTPGEITVSGEPDAIKDINSIMLGTVDMTSFGISTQRTFPIILPDGLINESGENEAVINLEVRGLVTEWRSVSDIQAINVHNGYRAEITTRSLDVRIRGTAADVASISPENLWIVADLSEQLGTGTSRVQARAYTRGSNAQVDIVSDVQIVVSIYDDSEELP